MTDNRKEHQSRKRKLTHKFKHVTKESAGCSHIKGKKSKRDSINISL